MADKVKLMITSAVVIGGLIRGPGTSIEVDDALAKNLLNRGKAELDTREADIDLSKQTVPELKEMAEALDVDGFDAMKKVDLIAAIEAAWTE